MHEREDLHGRGEETEEENEKGIVVVVVVLLERAAREMNEDAIGEMKWICCRE